MKFLFVVHRTYPYNGGSEYNIKTITEELSDRHEVVVLTDLSAGGYGLVNVTNDKKVLFDRSFDLVVIHGADMPLQDYVLNHISLIPSKTLYWIIKPSDSQTAQLGMENATYIGWGTSFDYEHIKKYKKEEKAVCIRYSINPLDSTGEMLYRPDNHRIYTSAGGFAPHKGFQELASVFSDCDFTNVNLNLIGYIGSGNSLATHNIIVSAVGNRQIYLNMLKSSDLYIMNSYEEGFGLVILDCMLNRVPWIGRDIAGCHDLKKYGQVYSSIEELKSLLLTFKRNETQIEDAYKYVTTEATPQKMVDDFMTIFKNKL